MYHQKRHIIWACLISLCVSCASSSRREKSKAMANSSSGPQDLESSLFGGQPTPENQAETSDETSETHPDALAHPKEATSNATTTLIFGFTQPLPQELNTCFLNINASAKEADNDNALLKALSEIQMLIGDNIRIYHWCFYQLAHKLDEDLIKDQVSFEKKGEQFYASMKIMWILAKALENRTGDFHYFSYLSERYREISKNIFGREITPVAPSLDQRRKLSP